MSKLERFDDLQQGSELWHKLRADHPMTASRTPIVLGLSPFSNIEKLAQEIKFGIKPFYSKAMQDGNDLEDLVREKANEALNDYFMPTVAVNGELLASLDGINFTEDTIIEIKVSEKTFNDIKSGNIPDHYLWQIKHQMQVFETVKKAYLIAYNKNTDEIAISDPILKDERFGDDFFKILGAWKDFNHFLEDYELPVKEEIENIEAIVLANKLFDITEEKKKLEEEEKQLKEQLKAFVVADKVHIGNLTISKTKGRKTVDYGKLISDKQIADEELEKYTKISSESLAFRFSKNENIK